MGRAYLGIAASAAILLYGAALAVRGIYPFGGRSVLLYDMGNQYAVFHSYLHQILTSGASPLFSWRVDLGMNFLPVFGYYLASPFSLLVLLFPDKYIPEAMVLIMLLKIGTGSACMAALLRRISECPKTIAAVFGATYAVGAWTVAYGFNVMWLDVLYLLPLALLAVERLLTTGRILRLALVFAAAFLVNFYDAALLLPFVAVYLLGRKVGLDGGVRIRALATTGWKFGIALAVGIATSGVLLFPVLFALIHGRTAVLGTDAPPVPVPWSGVSGRLIGGTMDWNEFSPNFASTSAVLVVASVFPFVRSIPRYERVVFSGLALLLLLGSQNIDIYLLWHAAEKPNGFPYRYAFMMPAVLSIMACRAWPGLRGQRASTLVIRSGAMWVAVLAVDAVLQGWLVTPVVLACAGISVLAAGAVFALRARLGDRRHILRLCAIVVFADAAASVFLEMEHVPYPYRSAWTNSPASTWRDAMRSTAPSGSDFHRTESVWSNFDNGHKLSHNDSLRTGAYELNHFSSMSSGELHEALTALGFTHYQSLVWVSDTGSTLASDAFLGMTDIVAPGRLSRVGVDEVRSWPPAPTPVTVYHNPSALPGGFVATDFKPAGELTLSDPFTAQGELLGDPELFARPCDPSPSVTGGALVPYGKAADGHLAYRVLKGDRSKPIEVTWKCHASGASQVYGWTDTLMWGGVFPGKGAFHVQLDNGPKSDYPTVYDNGIHDFGAVPRGDFTVTVTTRADSFAIPADFVRSIAVQTLRDRVAQLSATALHDVTAGDGSFKATAASPNGGIAVIPIPHISGWSATVDGHETEIQRVDTSFIGLALGPGTHHIELRFRPPGLRIGFASSTAGLFGLTALFIRERRKGRAAADPLTGVPVIPAQASGLEEEARV